MTSSPLLTVLSLDPVLRDGATAGMLLDLPGALAVRYDVDPADGLLRRTVLDTDRVLESAVEPVEHCVSCALRDDLLPTLRRLACREPSAVVLAPPVGTEPGPLLAVLRDAPAGLRPSAVVVAASAGSLEDDLLGDVLLAEAGLAASEEDRRAVGEVLARGLDVCDAVLLDGAPSARTATLLRHLVPPSTTVGALHDVPAGGLLDVRPADDGRGDLRHPEPTGAADRDGVTTVDLADWRPLHPARLLDALPDLGGGRLRGRGRFWLPTRPYDLCGWDGAGGQLRVGPLGRWSDPGAPGWASTRIVVTGVDVDEHRLRAAFGHALVTDAELAGGVEAWWCVEDGLEPWLGPIGVRA